jgi:hypothetical protein
MKPEEWLEANGFTHGGFLLSGGGGRPQGWIRDGIKVQQTRDGNFQASLNLEGCDFSNGGATPELAVRSLLRDVEDVAASLLRWRGKINL